MATTGTSSLIAMTIMSTNNFPATGITVASHEAPQVLERHQDTQAFLSADVTLQPATSTGQSPPAGPSTIFETELNTLQVVSPANASLIVGMLTGITFVGSMSTGLVTITLPKIASDVDLAPNLLLWYAISKHSIFSHLMFNILNRPASVYPYCYLVCCRMGSCLTLILDSRAAVALSSPVVLLTFWVIASSTLLALCSSRYPVWQ